MVIRRSDYERMATDIIAGVPANQLSPWAMQSQRAVWESDGKHRWQAD